MYMGAKIEINTHMQKYYDIPRMQKRGTRYYRGKPEIGKNPQGSPNPKNNDYDERKYNKRLISNDLELFFVNRWR